MHAVYFAPVVATDGGHEPGVSYVLFFQGADVGGGEGQVITWYLDDKCHQVNRTMPFAVETLTDMAMEAMSPMLVDHHALPEAAMEDIHSGVKEVLKIVDAKNRAASLPVWKGRFPSFGTYPVSHDGMKVLYIVHGHSTQSGIRPHDELPQIFVVDIATKKEWCRLKGHTDAIMWADWSPDDQIIATACWDQHYRIWDAETGDCRHDIGPTGGQNWTGAFSPDGKHLLFSGGQPVKVAIYDIETGEEKYKLGKEGLELDSWIRYLSWYGSDIALINDKSIVIWTPTSNKVDTVFKLKTDGTMLTEFHAVAEVKWADEGKKPLLQDAENTTFVWDRENNTKWRFQRPISTALEGDNDVLYVRSLQTVLSLDGDGKLRFWTL